jgi:signal transduction histidine kinase
VLAEEKRQTLTMSAPRELTATADRLLLRSALSNIVDNAIKYSPERASISVEITMEEEAAVIAIADNGPGIAEAHHPRIFDRFYRVDAGRSREMGGVGLGLAIAQWAVAANGGRIELRSREGNGSTFRIVLPHSAPHSAPHGAPDSATPVTVLPA